MQMKKFHEKKLKRKFFEIIKENYVEIKNVKLDYIKAERFDAMWSKRIYFSNWLDKMEDKNDIKVLHLAYKANKHYENSLAKSSFKIWIEFIKEQREFNVSLGMMY